MGVMGSIVRGWTGPKPGVGRQCPLLSVSLPADARARLGCESESERLRRAAQRTAAAPRTSGGSAREGAPESDREAAERDDLGLREHGVGYACRVRVLVPETLDDGLLRGR